jgi:Polyketide cyclase / dehydrase and lipid transport
MFKAFVVIVAALTLAIATVLVLASMKPDTFQVKRSLAIKAPPDKIYPLIADFRQWPQWSPYENKDPNMKRTYGSVASGKGATYAWDGDKNIGAGSMEITDAGVPSLVALKLDFTKPFEAHNIVDFTLASQGDDTVVTWDMRGPTPFLGKVIHVFMNMDKMVGADFAAGLAKMKQVAEAK